MEKIDTKNVIKFVFFSLLGMLLFLIPIPYQDSFTIPAGIIIDMLKGLIGNYLLIPVVLLITVNTVLTIITKLFHPAFIMKHKWFANLFNTTPLYLISRIIGMVIAIMYYFKIGPEFIIGSATGEVMIGMLQSLISVLLIISFTMPMLTEFGIMEFIGTLIRNIVRPLYKVPGRAAIDLITSWLGAPSAAVLLTIQQYDKGFYTGKEAVMISTNFSFVTIPFAYLVATILKVEKHFTPFYFICAVTGFLMAFIMVRIPPISKKPETYSEKTGKQLDEDVPEGMSRIKFAFQSAAKRASSATAEGCFKQGLQMFGSVIFGLGPVIVAWGTIALILVEKTPVFNFISYPFGLFLQLLGIPEAMAAAPSTLVGFADMFIPPIILGELASLKTRFIVGAATLLQLIYMTEVGAILLDSDVPIDLKDLAIIFLERTIIALILVTILSNLIMGF